MYGCLVDFQTFMVVCCKVTAIAFILSTGFLYEIGLFLLVYRNYPTLTFHSDCAEEGRHGLRLTLMSLHSGY